jgi:hypothetical protein
MALCEVGRPAIDPASARSAALIPTGQFGSNEYST